MQRLKRCIKCHRDYPEDAGEACECGFPLIKWIRHDSLKEPIEASDKVCTTGQYGIECECN
jgi:hypothetical protein